MKASCSLIALVLFISLAGCDNGTEPPRHTPSQREKTAKQHEAHNAAANKVKYAKAFSRFEKYVLTRPGVRGTQQFGDDGFRVYIAGDASDYQVREIGQALYDRFVAMRKPYMSQDDAQSCMIFVYDDTGHELGTTSEWNR